MSKKGFTLVEIMIVVAIVALLAAIAIPNLLRARQNADVASFVSMLKQMESAVTRYSFDNDGSFPVDVLGAVRPAGLDGYIPGNLWEEVTPLKGDWDWDEHLASFGWIRISIIDSSSAVTQSAMLNVDTSIDDGDLSTGNFRQEGSNYRYFLVGG